MTAAVREGEVVALVGPNGAGKTTLLRCVVGLDEPDSGEVLLDGRPLDTRDAAVRGDVLALLDDTAWFPDLTVLEHLDLLARADSVVDPTTVARTALADLGLTRVADQVPGTLSSGQRQRLSLAVALVRPWRLLLVDEPEQRLDADGRAWLGEWLALQAREGRSVLMACHSDELVTASGARVLEVGAG
ncbi:ABC transporter ATP-binding protein [Nocardioides jishulii]|uniref:ABC transporter ATP-binding protein n=2 Tax=Nocardioides jishulii TaxID=2575440 RepID=A0A4U2YIM3_9ACTN|nr:ABC transporter ATP-binding protein [Nocardioides jishulii]TKI60967.1 ABC transporter ATP-binding protein [Nocardioides jishulii]